MWKSQMNWECAAVFLLEMDIGPETFNMLEIFFSKYAQQWIDKHNNIFGNTEYKWINLTVSNLWNSLSTHSLLILQRQVTQGSPCMGSQSCIFHSAPILFCGRLVRRLQFVHAEIVHHLLGHFCQDTLSKSFFGSLNQMWGGRILSNPRYIKHVIRFLRIQDYLKGKHQPEFNWPVGLASCWLHDLKPVGIYII